jgi:sugar phosphate isomerase/epimerase
MITISAFADEIGPDLKLQMDTCEKNGVRSIDVRSIEKKNVSKMSVGEAREYKKQLDDRGFAVPCLGSPIGKITMDDDFEEHLELLKHCCEVGKGFGTSRIRMFSFYPSEDKDITDQRSEVMSRMEAMVKVAEQSDVILLHENERRIYGAKPRRVLDLFNTIQSEHFQGIFDPGNFVEEDVSPYDDAWKAGLAELTAQFHIKDKVPGAPGCAPAGEGAGQFEQIFTDVKARNWGGYMTLEPHMKAGGQFSGFTGVELFATAVRALNGLLERAGLEYQ